MTGTVEKALRLWGMEGAEHHMFAARENVVHQVRHQGATYALRLHRQGYRSDEELISELQMMAAAGQAGLHVPAPVAAASGAYVQVVDGVQIDVLDWLGGAPLGKSGNPLDRVDGQTLFRAIGREMARLHAAMDAWIPPAGFTRCAWDHDGLLGAAPVWGRFWDNATLSAEDRALFETVRQHASDELTRLAPFLEYGLIHADLVRENILLDGDRVQMIDFDDAGFGFRLFDVATTLLKNISEPDYPALKAALLAGYGQVRALDTAALDLFVLLRSATYVGWIATRLEEDGATARNARFIATTRHLAQDWLSEKGVTP
ncbi:phosphotransferase enzyme family protein [Pseudooceanicola sp.]|uniref:phosphotransferase enzyme family protein n=1 Tax=Pseudooceanicola sp. TaxID=1914328 RepID=UPI0035C7890B